MATRVDSPARALSLAFYMSEYWQRIRDEADRLGTDGCTMGSAAFRDCCARHDIEWRRGTTIDDEPVTIDEADARFLACMQSRSRLGWWSPIAWLRYVAVRTVGRRFRPKRP